MSDHAQSLGPIPYFVPGPKAVTSLSNRDLPWLLSVWWVHEGSARDSYALDLAYNILYLLLTEVCFSEIMGRMACSWNSIWWMCSLNSPRPTKTHLEKESPNLGRRWAQSGVVDWFAVLPFVCNPFSGAVTNSTTFTTGQGETCKRAAPTSSA